MSKNDEIIVVIEREKLFQEINEFQGFTADKKNVECMNKNLSRHFEEMRRGDAETNPLYKQPIPYVIVKVGADLFTYKRLNKGGEERLHNMISIGLGGHMNTIEGKGWDELLLENLQRELNEELEIKSNVEPKLTTLGFINDDSNEVGKVHIGILIQLEYPEGTEIRVKEVDQLAGKLSSAEELKLDYDHLENWSKIALDVIVK
ncbi:hypothetical protein [Paenibacillus sp. GXUN7292]|uniref:hypothetical protein n=1 Tax=Paenibacillus sp. GXUN7292 TaxID=3422499 RepID=UPI003D7EFD9F